MARCSKDGCLSKSIWGTEKYGGLCWFHLERMGEAVVNEWRKNVVNNQHHLQGANLYNVNLQEAYLVRANLQDAELWDANLQRANLKEANLQEANLSVATLQGADLSLADLQQANLWGANLQGADLAVTKLKDAYLSDIKYNRALRLPDSVKGLLLALVQNIGQKFTKMIIALSILVTLLIPCLTGHFIKPIALLSVIPLLCVPITLSLIWLVGRKFSIKKIKKEFKEKAKQSGKDDYLEQLPELAKRIMFPTLWGGAIVDAVGPCNPLDLRYIKDQSYLEARLENAKNGWQKFWMYLWGITCGYGSNILLWIFWSLLLVVSFGAAYSIGGIGENEMIRLSLAKADPSWFTPYYFSVVTFTTLGLGDVTPVGHWMGEIMVTAEVILGYIMLGGLISIFANKLARLA